MASTTEPARSSTTSKAKPSSGTAKSSASSTVKSSTAKSSKPKASAKTASSKLASSKPKARDAAAASNDANANAKVHKLSLKGSAKLVAEFFHYSIHTILFQRGVYPAEDFTAVKRYNLNMLVSSDDQVKAYIKKIMSQLDRWMVGGKISRLVIVITDKDTGENVERWQFDVDISLPRGGRAAAAAATARPETGAASQEPEETRDDENSVPPEQAATEKAEGEDQEAEKSEKEIQDEIAAIFRQITASVTFLPQLQGDCTFNVLVYADADSDVPVEWGDSDAKEIRGGEKVQLRGFSTGNHRVGTIVSYRLAE